MLEKLLEQRISLLEELRHNIVISNNDKCSRLQIAINELDDIINQIYSLWYNDQVEITGQNNLIINNLNNEIQSMR